MTSKNQLNFPFSDLVAGYIRSVSYPEIFDCKGMVEVETSDGRMYTVKITDACYAELVRNLGEPFQVAPDMNQILVEDRFVHVYGLFYPEADSLKFEAKHMLLFGRGKDDLRFEDQNWWTHQIQQLLNFYLEAQFQVAEGEAIDFKKFRTDLSAEGKKQDGVQNLDTISRLVYGFATAYMITGDERALEAATNGTEYMQRHFRHQNKSEGICYWYSQIDIQDDGSVRKYMGSTAGGDEGGNAIPCYEQIYALAGPTQTWRLTGGNSIRHDIDDTIAFLNRYYKDHGPYGGYYSHVDPVTFDAKAESLGVNKAKKNWNSVGDHAPAYLINLYLATGEESYAKFLEDTFDTICEHFPDYGYSPFMNEKFYEDWTHDLKWGIHQARCVVGHNLKVAWNLTRMHSLNPKESYKTFAHQIADAIPPAGCDNQRGGWYDMMERTLKDGEEHYRRVWHDRKAWWQQEQGILAYYIYFNVLANGQPYALGSERGKGSHSMAGYHSFELCFLAAIYSNLLVTKQAMDFYFHPDPQGWPDNKLRVAPDLLPAGSVELSEVWIDDKNYNDFDRKEMIVNLPESDKPLRVRVRIEPAGMGFSADLTSFENGIGKFALDGDLTRSKLPSLKKELEKLTGLKGIVLDMTNLKTVDDTGWNYLLFTKQQRGASFSVQLSGLNSEISQSLKDAELDEEFQVIG
jgi:mannose/cellobiose epimerase-like protein (N-acyl-D-glucosamine 2-epimerase family)/ABC-type transporter Mla MlaB component